MFIYAIKNIIDEKRYIGKTSKTIDCRWKQHYKKLMLNCHINCHLQNAWNLYGEQSFIIEQIDVTDSLEKLNELERYYISILKTEDRQFGYNLSSGGTGGVLSNEVYQQLRNRLSGRKLSNVHKLNISNSLKGREIAWKEKIALANKGKRPSDLAIQRSKELFTGIPLLDETKKKISISVKNAHKKMSLARRTEINNKISTTQKGKLAGGVVGKLSCDLAKKRKKELRVPINDLITAICSGLTIGEIAVKFNVGIATISRMCFHYWGKSIKTIKKEGICFNR